MSRKNSNMLITIIAILSCIAIISRLIPIPQFKPFLAIIILSSIMLNTANGIIISFISIVLSNIFLGQGPWTIWQLIACFLICIASNIFFDKYKVINQKNLLITFGFFSTFIIYGGILNLFSILFYSPNKNLDLIISYFSLSLPFDLINSISTAIFTILLLNPFIFIRDKLYK